jgi:curved DNA-binding protein CbpA
MTEVGSSDFIDYYELLGITPDTEVADIRRAFIRVAKENHPDAGGSTEVMQQLNLAYKTLMSPTAKGAYDMLHNFHSGTTKPSEYKYHAGRQVREVTDMSDTEIDSFLDSLFDEYRNGPPEPKPSLKQRFKKLLEL